MEFTKHGSFLRPMVFAGLPGVAVRSFSQERQGHITLDRGPGGKLLIADGTVRSNVRLAFRVPVGSDALVTERVPARDGNRDAKTVETYGTDQV